MYQSIFYNRDKNSQNPYHIYLRDDVKGITCFKHFSPVYKLDDNGDYTTLFGDKCNKIKGRYDYNDSEILEKDINKELAVLRDLYYKKDDIPKFHNTVLLDIEIEILDALTPQVIKAANAEITAIALMNNTTKEKICFILDKKGNLEETYESNKRIIPCKSERLLINLFLNEWENMDPTIVVGYNSDYFDIPYLYYRIKRILGDEVLRLSPIGKIVENPYNPNSPITIGLVNSLDFLLLFKKFISKEEGSYKLGDIGKKYINLGKIEYNGSLDTLYKEDINKYIDYNLRDVDILEGLEDKLKFIQLTILMCHLCHVPYESIYYNTVLNEGAVLTYLKRKNIVSPNKPTTTNPSIKELDEGDIIVNNRGTPTIEGVIYKINGEMAVIRTKSNSFKDRTIYSIRKKESYAGGFLLNPIIGLHKWLFDEDVTSYYPFSIITVNIGIETLIGRILTQDSTRNIWCSLLELQEMDGDEIITIERLNKKTYVTSQTTVKVSVLIKMIQDNNWAISANGVIFRKDIKSITAEILEVWFGKRKTFKDLMKKAFKDLDITNGEFYNLYQHSFKILLNSLYGTYAINGWRYTDGFKMCSSATTCTGQRLIQESILYINEEMDKRVNLEQK